MPLDHLWHDQAFDLGLLLTLGRLRDSNPVIRSHVYKHDFEFSCREEVANDKVMPVALQRLAALEQQQGWVSFELHLSLA